MEKSIQDEALLELALLKEIIVEYMTENDSKVLFPVRNAGADHPLLDWMPTEGAASAEAVDRHAFMLLPLLAQFATGMPRHSAFKAWVFSLLFPYVS